MISLITFSACVAQDVSITKVKEFENKREEGQLYYNIYSDEAPTGNSMRIDVDGNIYIYQRDIGILYTLNSKSYEINKTDYLKLQNFLSFMYAYKNYLGFHKSIYDYLAIEKKSGKLKFEVNNLNFEINAAYYDEDSDVLFLTDRSGNIYSVINPENDNQKNEANYHNPNETEEIFSKNGSYSDKNIYIENNALYKNGSVYYFYGSQVNGYNFYLLDTTMYIYLKNELFKEINLRSKMEIFESAAVHPCGDIYILRFNETQNRHILYRIENTWDSAWRKQWYKEH